MILRANDPVLFSARPEADLILDLDESTTVLVSIGPAEEQLATIDRLLAAVTEMHAEAHRRGHTRGLR